MDQARYDLRNWTPMVKGSMCNGTQCAGFRNMETGIFEEVCKLNAPQDLRRFQKRFHLQSDQIRREW